MSAILAAWLGVFTLSWATNVFSVWTAEDARRIRVLSNSSKLPTNLLLSHREDRRSIPTSKKPFVVLDFIYTRCPTVCNTLGVKFKQLQNQLIERGVADQVDVLSISFDLNHDSPQALKRYLNWHQADESIWSALVPQSSSVLNLLKQRFGVVVIDDKLGGFTHNAAIYVVKHGRLKKIFNDDDIDSVIHYLEESITLNSAVQAKP